MTEQLYGKLGKLAIFIRKYSILADTRIKCKYCSKKIEHKMYMKHLQNNHTGASYW